MMRSVAQFTGQQLQRFGDFLEKRAAGETIAESVSRHYRAREADKNMLVNEAMTEDLAMRLADVYACVKIISETKGSLPCDILETKRGGKTVEVESHPVKTLLTVEPNPDSLPMSFQEARQAHLALWGNSFTGVDWDDVDDEATRLTVLHPSSVTVHRDLEGELYYKVSGAKKPTFGRGEILHVPGFSIDGVMGKSPIRCYMGDMIRLGLVEERFVGKFFDNGARPSIAITVPEELKDDSFKRIKNEVEDQVNGRNAWKVLLLEGGADVKNFTMPLAEAQLLESRVYRGKKIATCVFNCPPLMVGHMDDANNNSVDAMIRYFARHTMRPWVIRDEQELTRKLFRGRQRGRFQIRYNLDGLERGDLASRYAAHKNAIFAGFMTLNEVRALEDLPPLPGGDDLAKPAAIFGKAVAPGSTPAAGGDDDKKSELDDENVRGAQMLGYVGLTRKVSSGLVNRQVVALERAAKSAKDLAEFQKRAGEIFDAQIGMVRDRLGDVAGADCLASWVGEHRNDLNASIPAESIEDLVPMIATLSKRWSEDVPDRAKRWIDTRNVA